MLNLKNQKGIALITTYLLLMVLIIFASAFFIRSTSQNSAALAFKKQIQTFNLAEAGLDRTIIWLRAQPSPPTGNYNNPWGGVQSLGSGSYNVAIVDLGVPPGAPGTRRYKVISTGTVGTTSQSLTNYLQTDNYARYIWFTDRETFGGTNVWFWSQDHLNGPTHTNGHFCIFRNPVFDGETRSVDAYIRYFNNGNNINSDQLSNPPYDNPSFLGGMTFGAEQFNMPTQALNLRTASSAVGGLRLRGNTTVVLNADGTMNVTNSRQGWNNRNMALPTNGALFVDRGSVTISGTLNGRLTVGASQNIIIPNNIVYAADPRNNNPLADDVLGLIAEQDVVISASAPTNLEIDASIMGLSTSFMLENWWTGPPKGTLSVYGGIIQNERGPVGTFNGSTGQKISGYSKNYTHDTRLLTTPPPFFPTTGDYITLVWED